MIEFETLGCMDREKRNGVGVRWRFLRAHGQALQELPQLNVTAFFLPYGTVRCFPRVLVLVGVRDDALASLDGLREPRKRFGNDLAPRSSGLNKAQRKLGKATSNLIV